MAEDRALSELLSRNWTKRGASAPEARPAKSSESPAEADLPSARIPKHGWRRSRADTPVIDVSGKVVSKAALHRRAYEEPKDGSDLFGVSGSGSVPTFDSDIYRRLSLLRRRSRQEYERNPYVKRTVRLWKQNIVGPGGIKLRAMPRNEDGTIDRDLAKLIENGWARFSRFGVPDVTGRLAMQDIENLVVFGLLVDGEFFCLEHRTGDWGFQIEVFDPQRVDPQFVDRKDRSAGSREVVMGVEIDRMRRPTAYFVDPDPGLDVSVYGSSLAERRKNRRRWLARSVCHVMDREFAQQIRGVPGLATSLSRWDNIRGYEDSEMLAARLAASKVGFLSKSDDGTAQIADDVDETDGSEIIDAEPGSVTQLEAGVSFQSWDPTHPSSNFGDFLRTQLQAAAVGSGATYPDVSGDMASVNFSSLRQQNITQRDQWRMAHRIVTSQFNDWIYGKWVAAMLRDPGILGISLGDLSPRQISQIMEVTWVPRSYEHVQPREQASAEWRQLRNHSRSVSSFIRERGEVPDEVFEEIASELETMRQLGIIGAAPSKSSDEGEEDGEDEDEDEDEDE